MYKRLGAVEQDVVTLYIFVNAAFSISHPTLPFTANRFHNLHRAVLELTRWAILNKYASM